MVAVENLKMMNLEYLNLKQLYEKQIEIKGVLNYEEKRLTTLVPSIPSNEFEICKTNIKMLEKYLEDIKEIIEERIKTEAMDYSFPMLRKIRKN
jgi:hypothetical protein